MNGTIDVSVIIVTFNNRDQIEECLESIRNTSANKIEVIVVDNASTDGTASFIESEFPQVQLVRRATNGGFAVGVNEGIAHSRGRTLFIVNPDTRLLDTDITPMLAYLGEHPTIGLLAPKLLDPDGKIQLSCRAFPTFSTALFNRYSVLTRLFPRNKLSSRYLMSGFHHASIADVDWVSGAAWLLPRSTVDAIGLLDEAYFWSIEDVDFCQRIHRAGLRVVYYPEVRVQHAIGASLSRAAERAIIARHKGMWRYYAKYMRPSNAVTRAVTDLSIAVGVGVRCCVQLVISSARRRSQSRSTSTGT